MNKQTQDSLRLIAMKQIYLAQKLLNEGKMKRSKLVTKLAMRAIKNSL